MFPKEYVLVAFIAVILVYFILKYATEWYMRSKEESDLNTTTPSVKTSKVKASAEDCAEGGCGMRSICSGKEDVQYDYYEDEELDNYKGRKAEDYTTYEISEFRDVLETLRKEEVAPWLNSLCARGVALPAQLRSEAIALANSAKI